MSSLLSKPGYLGPRDESETLAGVAALIRDYGLDVPVPSVISVVGGGRRGSEPLEAWEGRSRTQNRYLASYCPESTLHGHLRFALKYEAIDFAVLSALFRVPSVAPAIHDWVLREPTSQYARRAWFFYEYQTGDRLPLPDVERLNYVPAVNDTFQFTLSRPRLSQRHRVADNVAGTRDFVPLIRRTPLIEAYKAKNLGARAIALSAETELALYRRAVSYFYRKETRSSFEIENETVTLDRESLFMSILATAAQFDPCDISETIRLQHSIVDPRFAAQNIRDFQNFIGSTLGGYREEVHFICPKPDDVGRLMEGWAGFLGKASGNQIDPVVLAAAGAFGFVFIHPFEDGNGRIHRFLLHNLLVREGFLPAGDILPVSAAFLRDMKGYDAVLETVSRPAMSRVVWSWNTDRSIVVANDTLDLYRYFDATPMVEFLYAKIENSIEHDMKGDIEYLAIYDKAREALRQQIDMPERRAELFVKFCLQNAGKLPKRRRAEFDVMTDAEIAAVETDLEDIMKSAAMTGGVAGAEPSEAASLPTRPATRRRPR